MFQPPKSDNKQSILFYIIVLSFPMSLMVPRIAKSVNFLH